MGINENALTQVRLFLLENVAGVLGHLFVAVHAGEVGQHRLDDELEEVVDVLDMARVVHLLLDSLGHVRVVHEPLQDRLVSSSMHARGHVELVVEITAAGDHPEANCALVNHSSFSAERRKRAYFASPEFDLTALSRLTGGCTVAEFFDIDQGRGPYVMRSGSSGCKSNCEWHSIEQHAPTLTSNGLLMRNERTGREWRVPTDDMAKLRSLAALPTSHTNDATARRCAVARAVDGKVSDEIAKQLSAMR